MCDKVTGRILVVDDQENWRKVLTTLLTSEGHNVRTVANFEEAERALLQNKFDVLILDVRLEDTDTLNVQGIELLDLAKAQEKVPSVIMLTGYPESIRKGVLDRYKADALMLKVPPGGRFDSQEFKDEVQKQLRKTHAG
jgi:CheY-like chemotaxis protein